MNPASEPAPLVGRNIPYREVRLPEAATTLYDDFVGDLVARIEKGDDRNEICRETLQGLFGADGISPLRAAQFDPRNVTLEPEYYGDIDLELYRDRKPLLWLWCMFDRSPLALNLDLGFRLRRALAPFVFRKVGKNFKCFPFVEFTFGYNLEVGDDVVFHRYVFIDDRGGVKIGNHTSLSDYVNVYSHTHDINCRYFVDNIETVVGDNCRVTYHATVLAGTHLADNSLLGACGLLTRETKPGAVYVGIPAKKVKEKDPRHMCSADHHHSGLIT